jgi:hypothetical protein
LLEGVVNVVMHHHLYRQYFLMVSSLAAISLSENIASVGVVFLHLIDSVI